MGLKPQMGFNTWNKFHCDINEQLARDTADAIVEKGLDKLGYVYLNLDDCWQVSRDNNSVIVPDPKTFPSGMKALADYVHEKGLLFGLYSDAGYKTCDFSPRYIHSFFVFRVVCFVFHAFFSFIVFRFHKPRKAQNGVSLPPFIIFFDFLYHRDMTFVDGMMIFRQIGKFFFFYLRKYQRTVADIFYFDSRAL